MLFKRKIPTISGYTSNPLLTTIKNDWPGTPLDQEGLFINSQFPTILSIKDIIKFITQRNPQKALKKRDTWRIPVIKDDSWLYDPSDKIVWLGHASFFIQLSNVRILIDPMFGRLAVAKRYSEMPVDPQKFKDIDYILISHAHYDHCDKKSLKILSLNNPNATILCGLKLNALIKKWVKNPIQTAGWYQQYPNTKQVQIAFLPSRHWANRSLIDVNTTLWGGFLIQGAGKTIYFSGDSGYGTHFKDIGELMSNINIALIGAGAYAPTWFMGQYHQDPNLAAQAFEDTKAKIFIPFHYGTFDSADEPMGEPEQILNQLKEDGKIKNNLKILKLGEVFPIN
ncbi:MAG TPA: MBL fold metallo-hydrolase [Bacteroidia bacterium]